MNRNFPAKSFIKMKNAFEEELKVLRDKFYSIVLVLMILIVLLSMPFALSQLFKSVNIANRGRIGVLKSPITYKSEIRGVFIHSAILSFPHNWTVIAQTLARYGIDSVYFECFDIFKRFSDIEISRAITAFHNYGIEFHAVMNCIAESYNPETAAVDYRGNKPDPYAQCPIKVKRYVEAAIRNFISNHSGVDGIMIDYMRTGIHYCYCDEHRAMFDQWYYENYGEHVSNWTEFYPDQPKWNIYANWRNEPVNELVKITHDTAKALKPDIVISAAVWTYFSDCPIYWRKFLGQDTGRWIREGWIDMVAPMMYTDVIYGKTGETLESFIDACLKYMVGGVEGKIPLLAFLGLSAKNASNFAAQVDYVRSRGLDGWIFWRYGGPGVDSGGYLADITPYLEAITMSETFKLGNIQVSVGETEATITWTTNLPTTSRVEYNTLPLFNATWTMWGNFPYWRINHNLGNVIENLTYVMDHSIILTGLMPKTQYFFRIQSEGPGGIATSETLTFTTR
ncbi:MAG: family 10 glycosylhydrolase [Nitrososphaerota archaeon]